MRKISVFLSFSLFVLILFSCDFQIPKGIEVHGNPAISFAAHNDLGKTFEQMTSPGNQLIECVNTNIRTYIIRKEIKGDDFFSTAYPGDPFPSFTSPVDLPIGIQALTVSVDFGAVLTNFELENPKARIYIYGEAASEQLVGILKIEARVSADGNTDTYDRINRIPSGFNDSHTTFTGKALPGGQNTDIELPLSSSSMSIDFDIIIPKDTTVEKSWFQGKIHTEILIWVPLIFEATADAEIIIPRGHLFKKDKDLFGRSSMDGSSPIVDYVESLELSIILNQNPFIGRELVVWSGADYTSSNIKITNKMNGKAFSFPISSEDMEEINKPENFPFEPNFKILYEYDSVNNVGDKLMIPRELTAHELVFKAKFSYRTEF